MTSAISTPVLPPMNIPGAPTRGGDIEKAAKEFEGMFLSEMLSHMFDGLDVDPVFGGGSGEKMWRGMMVQEYGKMIAGKGGLGLSGQIKDMMLAMQEQRNGEAQCRKKPQPCYPYAMTSSR